MMNKRIVPLLLLILFILNNSINFLVQDYVRAEKIRDLSAPVAFSQESNSVQAEMIESSETSSSTVEEGTMESSEADALEDKKENETPAGVNTAMDYGSIEIPTIEEVEKAAPLKQENVNGILYIPSISLSLNILIGTNEDNMLYGATTGKAGQQMGQGNYVLFGHNMKISGVLFSDLPALKKGAAMQLRSREGATYDYAVTSIEIINKTKTSILKDTEPASLTLITCSSTDPDGKNVYTSKTPWRFVVRGELKE